MIELEQITAIKRASQDLARMVQKYVKMRDRDHADMTPKQNQKHSANLSWAAMEIDKATHDLHVLCVDAGLADCRDAESYLPVDYHPSGWHKYQHVRRKPACLHEVTACPAPPTREGGSER